MTSSPRLRTALVCLLTGASLAACASPEAVPYMSSENVANAAYTAGYNGSASANGTPRVKPASVPAAEIPAEPAPAAEEPSPS